ncbi:MAG TPA: type II toxin-antitoxin system VapC family toxin [Lacipirellulaceae bacterium]|jgi:predicted nucleic acid-binding protein|nr:type II toxin-antitoxin system VapC family toxin [Lacipirellulaceae bacterium]
MSGFVIDASVLIKLYINESGTSEAERAVKAADPILAPDLLLPETANVLWKYVRRGELSAGDANEILGDILQLPIRLTASHDLIEPALRIAVETSRSVYDSLYIALALQTDTILLTSDERLANAIAATRFALHLRLIGSAQ